MKKTRTIQVRLNGQEYRHGQNDHRHAALLLSCLSAASCQRKGQDNEYSEDPS